MRFAAQRPITTILIILAIVLLNYAFDGPLF